MSELCWQP